MKTKLFTFVILLFSSALFPQVPQTMDYSGKLTDGNGSFINGQINITFRLYDTKTGGTALWEETQSGVNVSNGFFHVQLGSSSSFPSGLFNNTDLWLGTEVDTDGEMAPRSKLATVAFSQNADNGVPVGAVMPFMGINPPAGWLICNGQSIASGDEYAELRAIVGDNVPDLRGEFLRGLDSGRGLDPDGSRSIGSSQTDAFQGHGHDIWLQFGNAAHPDYPPGGEYSFVGNDPHYGPHGGKVINPTSTGYGNPRFGTETRPHNVAVNYIIKY